MIFIDQVQAAFIVNLKGGAYRSVSEPSSEAVIRGPKEGFIESLSTNVLLMRQKIHSPDLKVVEKKIGQRTQTTVALMYLKHLAQPPLLEEVHRRLARIDIDGILESEYIEEFIEDHPFSPFPQIQNTERPDVVAANLLEGRIALFIHGSPSVLVLPTTFWQLLQSSEDYYGRFYFATFIRLLRYVFALMTLLLPAMYVAVSTFHIEMIPTNLLLTLMASRAAISSFERPSTTSDTTSISRGLSGRSPARDGRTEYATPPAATCRMA